MCYFLIFDAVCEYYDVVFKGVCALYDFGQYTIVIDIDFVEDAFA